MELNNTQRIMVTELKIIIERMKAEGVDYQAIREKCIEEGRENWIVTDIKEQDDAIAAALYLYAMDEKGREALNELSKILGVLNKSDPEEEQKR